MPYLGNQHNVGDHVNNFKVLDDISSHTATFDGSATSVVDTTNNTIRVPLHRFIQGQRVTYTNGGGGNIGGLTTGTAYFVSFDSANTIKLATTLANANSNTVINLSAVGSGTSHTLNAAFDGVNTKFKMTHGSGKAARLNNATQINVAINNVIQRPNLDPNNFTDGFALQDNHKIVFKTAPTVNDIFWGSIIANTIENFDLRDNEVDNFTGDGSTTEFTLSTIPANNESVIVSINGVVQHPSDKNTARSYTLIDSIIQFTAAPALGDEIQVRHIGFAGASTNDVSGFYGRTGNVALTSSDHITTGDITSRNINSSGIITATTFDGAFSSSVGGSNANFTGIVTSGVFKGGDIEGRNLKITGLSTFVGDASFSGNVSIGGTLTYEDVTNIDSVGIITAQSDVHVGAGVSAVGVGTFSGLDISGDIDVDGHTNLDNVSIAGVSTFSGDIELTSTDSGAAAAPTLRLQRDSSSPANQDVLGQIVFGGKDNTPNDENYASVAGKIIQAGAGGEHGAIQITTRKASANVITANLTSTDYELLNSTNLSVDGNITGNGNFKLTSTDTGSAAAPELTLHRNSSSPANNDYLGEIHFRGKDNAGNSADYATITGKILSTTNGAERGILEFTHLKSGTETVTGRWRDDSLQLLNSTNLSVAGNTTLTGDIDVDGHTNLDNLSVAGVSTFSGSVTAHDYRSGGGVGNTLYLTSADDWRFRTTGGSERLRIDSSGNVIVNNTTAAAGSYTYKLLASDNISSTEQTFGIQYPGVVTYGLNAESNADFTIKKDGTERLRIDSNGVICVNHTNALHSGKLQVSTSGSDAIDINAYSSTAANGGRLSFYRSKNATIGSNTIVADNDSLGRIDFRGYNTNGNAYNIGATIEAEVDGTVNSSTDMPSALVFKTSEDGSATPSERLRIESDGRIDVGGNENGYKFNIIDESNRTTTAETALLLYAKHDGSGTTGAGFGTGIRFWGDRASGNVEQNMGRIMCTAEVNSGTTLSGALSFDTSVAGSLYERLRITSDGDTELRNIVSGINNSYSQYLKFRTTQTNGQSAVTGQIAGQGKPGWGGDLVFYSKPANSTPNDSLSERLRIDSDGQVSVNYDAHHTSSSGILNAIATTSGRFAYKAIEIGSATADGTDQGALIVGRRKAASSIPTALLGCWDDGSGVTLYHGGGWSTHSGSATKHNFYTGDYATGNSNGSIRLSIGSKGQIYLNNRDGNNSSHKGNIIAYAPVTGEFAYKSLEIGATNPVGSNNGGLIVAQRKTNSAYPFALMGSWDNGSVCNIYYGGGWGSQSAPATHHKFYTGSYASSGGAGGSEVFGIDTQGNVKSGTVSSALNFTDSNSGNTKSIEIGATSGGDALLVTHSSGYGVGYFGYEAGGDRLVIACDGGSGNNKIDFITDAGTSTGGGTDNLNAKVPKMRISAAGIVTKPKNPAFKSNATGQYGGVGSLTTTVANVGILQAGEQYDHGGNYSTSTYLFTCPVDGVYLVNVTVSVSNVGTNRHIFVIAYTNGGGSAPLQNYFECIDGSTSNYANYSYCEPWYFTAGTTIGVGKNGHSGYNNAYTMQWGVHLLG